MRERSETVGVFLDCEREEELAERSALPVRPDQGNAIHHLGLSRERIRQLEGRALERLSRAMRHRQPARAAARARTVA